MTTDLPAIVARFFPCAVERHDEYVIEDCLKCDARNVLCKRDHAGEYWLCARCWINHESGTDAREVFESTCDSCDCGDAK